MCTFCKFVLIVLDFRGAFGLSSKRSYSLESGGTRGGFHEFVNNLAEQNVEKFKNENGKLCEQIDNWSKMVKGRVTQKKDVKNDE